MTSSAGIEHFEGQLRDIYCRIDRIAQHNQKRVLDAYRNYKVSEAYFRNCTGYGYGDTGRDIMEKIWAQVFGTQDALVRSGIIIPEPMPWLWS